MAIIPNFPGHEEPEPEDSNEPEDEGSSLNQVNIDDEDEENYFVLAVQPTLADYKQAAINNEISEVLQKHRQDGCVIGIYVSRRQVEGWIGKHLTEEDFIRSTVEAADWAEEMLAPVIPAIIRQHYKTYVANEED